MKHTYAIRNSILCSLITAAWSASAAVQPIVTELEFPTYGFSDPDPVPRTESPLYPYFRFDGSSEKSAPRKWKAVILENEKIKVTMLPEIGGKVWGAEDKASGKAFIYYNHAVKFRNIALRGPWCSGGIEFNFGITGHAPTSATPVVEIMPTVSARHIKIAARPFFPFIGRVLSFYCTNSTMPPA